MKKHRKRTYLQYFRKHFIIMLFVWLILCYLILQGVYCYLFAKIEQKTAANFYEGMELIQYATKDNSLKGTETEIMYALGNMSNAGNYALPSADLPSYYYPGDILGLRVDMLDIILDLSLDGHATDGEGNTYLKGNGRGWGFILDDETGEVACGTLGEKDQTILFLIDQEKLEQYSNLTNTVIYYAAGENLLYCNKELLYPAYEIMNGIENEWEEKLVSADKDAFVGKRLMWTIDTIYIKDDMFYPAKLSLYLEPSSIRQRSEAVEDQYLTEYIFVAPDADYVLYEPDPEKERVVCLALSSHAKDMADTVVNKTWKPDDAFRAEAMKALSSMKSKGKGKDLGDAWSIGNTFLYCLNGRMVFVRYAYFVDGEGHRYRACTYQTISDLFMGNRRTIFGWAAFLGIWLIILAMITSFLEYHRKRYQFMTEEYRRILMDSMAHDLKSPLMAISGYAENLSEHINDDKREHYVEEIQKSVGYMNDLVMKNLDIMKLDHVKKSIRMQALDMRKLIEASFEKEKDQISERKLTVNLEGEMTVRGDMELLQKVTDNLVSNAVRYTKEAGKIEVQFGKKTLVMKNDSALEYKGRIDHLWEPFVRGDESRSGKGTGLGLAIVSYILDVHGWKHSLNYDGETKEFICKISIKSRP